uniref:RNase NYN domain-containing protein n=1 Tax=Panagrellus redivivus TaxID=6233 RepID=A0A7E4ZSZ6_PANRE
MSQKSWEERCVEAEKPFYCCFEPSKDPLDVSSLRRRRVIIDGANLLHITRNAIPGASEPKERNDSLILLQLAYYFDFYGFRVRIVLPKVFHPFTSNGNVLQELVNLGYAVISSQNDKEADDRAALDLAFRIGAVIITNDKYRNHHGYGFGVKSKLCPVVVDNPERKRGEWPHYTLQKPLEHFYFINPERDTCYRRAVNDDARDFRDPLSSNKLANLFKFVSAVGWYQLHGEWSSQFPKTVYQQIPIDCRYLKAMKCYTEPHVFFVPDMIDKTIANKSTDE